LEPDWDELDKELIKNLWDVTATLRHYPGTFPTRIFDAYMRQQEGEDVHPMEYLLGERDDEDE